MRSKPFLIVSVSILILAFPIYKIVQACSDGPSPYDYYPQFFSPNVTNQPSFIPFQYTAELKYYDEWYDFTSDESLPDANITAWRSFTGNTVSVADLDSFIYSFSWQQLKRLYGQTEKGIATMEASPLSLNGFTAYIRKNKDLETLGYLMYAKQCEPYVAIGQDDWSVLNTDSAKMARLQKNGQQLYAVCKKDFIKERYAFQILRLAFQQHKYKDVLKLYSDMIGDEKKEGSDIFVRSLALKAGALFRLNRRPEAAYLYSLVFDRTVNNKRSAFISFDWATGKDVADVLPLCKTNHERAVLYLMDGLRCYGQALPQINAAFAADPEVDGLDVLVTREINKIEERYQAPALLRQRNVQPLIWYYDYYWVSDIDSATKAQMGNWQAYASQLNAFCQKAAKAGNVSRPAFWQLSSAYLYYVQGQMPAAKQFIAQANKGALTSQEQELRDAITVLVTIKEAGKMNSTTEAQLLPLLQSMEQRGLTNSSTTKVYRDVMATALSSAYLHNGDTMKAIFCLSRLNRTKDGQFEADPDFMDLPGSLLSRLSPQKIATIRGFLAAKNKTPFEQWLLQGNYYTPEVLTDLEATKQLRNYQFAKAAKLMETLPKNFYTKNLPNPFIAPVKDIMDLWSEDTSDNISKLKFAQEMLELSKRTDPSGMFAFGEGLYSMSYYGKAHQASVYYRSTYDGAAYFAGPDRAAIPSDQTEYYSLNKAEQVFVQVAAQTKDPELKAKSLWMAAKCWQKSCPSQSTYNAWDDKGPDAYYSNALLNPYFPLFRIVASQSEYGREALRTCDYLKDYLKKGK
ncbi:MAG: hypothetical protein JST36_00875 [Bacteroidetes bacterium]|nr:hypothetical protein [Bacteroidota bacterium]